MILSVLRKNVLSKLFFLSCFLSCFLCLFLNLRPNYNYFERISNTFCRSFNHTTFIVLPVAKPVLFALLFGTVLSSNS